MGDLVCKECGLKNDENAEFCSECGSKLVPTTIHDDNKESSRKGFLGKYSKIIILAVVLVGLLGITAQFLLFVNDYNVATERYQHAFNQSHGQAIKKAEWHRVANYTGIGNRSHSFSIKGEKFKVVINATPTINYNTNYMKVDVKDAKKSIGSGELTWTSRSAVKSKEKTIKVTSSPGKHYIKVVTKDLKKWKVTVYDYY